MAQWAKVLSLDSSDPHKNLLLLIISIIRVLGMGRWGVVAARDCWLASLTKRGKLLAQ